MIGYEIILRDPGTAIVGAAGIGAVGSMIAGNQQSSAIHDAANIQANASHEATAAQMEMFNKQQATVKPFVQAGTIALDQLPSMTAPEYKKLDVPAYDPGERYGGSRYNSEALNVQIPPELRAGYDQAKIETQKSIDRAAAARGGFFSGAAIEETGKRMAALDADFTKTGYQAGVERALADRADKQFGYNANAADARFGYQADRERTDSAYTHALNMALTEDQRLQTSNQNQYNRVLNLVNIGRGGATESGNAAIQTGSNIANLTAQNGANLANLAVAGGNANAATTTGISNAALSGMGAYLNYKNNQNLINSLTPVPK